MFQVYVANMDVALIQWPSDESLRQELAEAGHPRLLLVDADAPPPVCPDPLEDWVRLPVSRDDRNARVQALESLMVSAEPALPELNGHGTLEYGGGRTQLSSLQVRLIEPLIERFGAVVSREVLVSNVWPGTHSTSNKLDVNIGRLRRQLVPVGLKIRTVRSRGYLLCDSESFV